jgi:DNA-binding transcriptional LysR family regulator
MNETIDLNGVATFVQVVEHDGFTAAAEHLKVPKSTVSRSVKRLEQELGVRLLQRTTRRVSLTEAGRAYYERVSAALSGMDDARAAIGDMQDAPRGTVRITAPPDAGAGVLAPILARFLRKYPKIKVEMSLTNRYVDLVREGFDLALRMGKLADSSLIARPLGSIESGLFASPQYLARHPAPERLADLAHHSCVLFRPTNGKAKWNLTGPRGVEAIEVTGPLSTDDMAAACAAVGAGTGIGFLPLVALSREKIVRVLPQYSFNGVQAHVVYPSTRYVPMRVALLRDVILEGIPLRCTEAARTKERR